VAVSTFIGRMGQQVFPKSFQRVRSDGVPATRTFATIKHLRHEAWAKGRHVLKGASQIIAPLTSRQRSQRSPGRDPLRCPHGHSDMGGWRLWHPTYGVLHDEREAMKRGTEASQAPRADAARRLRRTVWPAARGRSLSLPGLR
jgi:hypothetical protein